MLHVLVSRIHRDERGNLALVLLFLLLVLWALVSLVWNTGAAVSNRVRVQTAADVSAHGAAVWTSRAVNLTTGTNMMIVQTISAETLASAAPLTALAILVTWIERLESAGFPVNPFSWPLGAKVASEVPKWLEFMAETLPVAIEIPEMHSRVGELHEFQDALNEAIPDAIEQQRETFADYFECDVHLSAPHMTAEGIRAPLHEGSWQSMLLPLMWRVYNDQDGWSSELQSISVGKGQQWWRGFNALFMVIYLFVHGDKHYILVTQDGFLEWQPEDDERRDQFSIIAAASATGPPASARAMPGVFKGGVNDEDFVLAFAQAETFNGLDSFPRDLLPIPWRVWSKAGVNWQSRLTLSDALERSMAVDGDLEDLFRRAGLSRGDIQQAAILVTH